MITASIKTRLHKGQRRSFGGRSLSVDLDEIGIDNDNETFYHLIIELIELMDLVFDQLFQHIIEIFVF